MQFFAIFTQNLLAKYIKAVFEHILCINKYPQKLK